MINTLVEFHQNVFFALHSLTGQSPLLDTFILFFGQQADLYVLGAAMLFILIHQHGKHSKVRGMHWIHVKELFLITLSVASAWIGAHVLKQIIGGLRPFEFFDYVEPLFIYGGGDTFPSGHATIFAALALMIIFLHKKVGIVFAILAFLISLGRVIAGVHYPADMIAGWIIGLSVSYLVYWAFLPHLGGGRTHFKQETLGSSVEK
jgi:undecaprenyl-diphosphatase